MLVGSQCIVFHLFFSRTESVKVLGNDILYDWISIDSVLCSPSKGLDQLGGSGFLARWKIPCTGLVALLAMEFDFHQSNHVITDFTADFIPFADKIVITPAGYIPLT